MPSIDLVVIFAIALGFILLGILLFPNVKQSKRKKLKNPLMPDGETKDWKAVSLRLEKYIHALRKEMALLEKQGAASEKDLVIEREKYAKLQEKISQERHWKKKEDSELEKRTNELVQLKTSLQQVEQSLAKEHGDRLRMEREMKELKVEVAKIAEEKLKAEALIYRHESENEEKRKQLVELQAENQRLAKKHDDATWIAKSEYIKTERDLQAEIRNREREIARLRTILQKEGFIDQ